MLTNTRAIRIEWGDCDPAGLVFDGQMTQEGESHARALCFHIEIANGQAVEVLVPYFRKFDSIVDFEEPQVTPVQAEIFVDVASPF